MAVFSRYAVVMRFSLLLALLSIPAFAQTPVFEVATIKPAPPLNPQMILSGAMRIGMRVEAGRVDIGFASLRDLIMWAYEVKPFQVSGPEWITGERWEVAAKMPEGATRAQVPAMLRALLEERFKLKTHRDSRDQNVYALEQGKGGHKLKEAAAAAPAPDQAPDQAPDKDAISIDAGGQKVMVTRSGSGPGGFPSISVAGGRGGAAKMSMVDGQMHMEQERTTMQDFASLLSPMLDRPVVDHTELKGNWQLSLDLAMQDMMQMARGSGMMSGRPGGAMGTGTGSGAGSLVPADPSGGSIFSSIEKLGLKLTKTKAAMELVVIDSAEKKPTEN